MEIVIALLAAEVYRLAGRSSTTGAAAALLALVVCGLAGHSIRRVVEGRRRGSRPLRRCPLCDADAVVAGERDELDAVQARAALQCGQCGTWRRVVTTRQALREHNRDLDRDRRTIGLWLARLEGDRALGEADAFLHALHGEMVGAEDFLAFPMRPGARVGRPRPEPER